VTISGIRAPIEKWQLEEFLHKRVVLDKIPISKLFLIIPCIKEIDGEVIDFETKYGKLLVFFCKAAPHAALLHKDKYDYPHRNFIRGAAFDSNGDLVN